MILGRGSHRGGGTPRPPADRGRRLDHDHGDLVSVHRFDAPPDIPAPLEELPHLRHALAHYTARAGGGLVEADVLHPGTVPTLRQVLKVPLPGRPTGQAFLGSYTLPRASRSAVEGAGPGAGRHLNPRGRCPRRTRLRALLQAASLRPGPAAGPALPPGRRPCPRCALPGAPSHPGPGRAGPTGRLPPGPGLRGPAALHAACHRPWLRAGNGALKTAGGARQARPAAGHRPARAGRPATAGSAPQHGAPRGRAVGAPV